MAKPKKKRSHSARLKKIKMKVEARLLKAMNSADSRGYTGMIGSKGHLFEDPHVKHAMKRAETFIFTEAKKEAEKYR